MLYTIKKDPVVKKRFYILGCSMLACCIFMFLVLEAGVRLYELRAHTSFLNRIEHYTRSWPLLQGVEGRKYFFELQPGIRKVLEGFVYQINGKGLRDSQKTFSPDPGAYRILTIGDSQTFGVGLDYENTYSQKLEKRLNDRYRKQGRTFQVWNGGVPSYNLEQTAGAFEQKTSALKPDMLILGLFIDSIVRPTWHFNGGIMFDPQKNYWLQQLFARSHLVSFILLRLKNGRFNPYNYYDGYYGTIDRRWNDAMEQIRSINAVCTSRGIAFLVLDLPTLFWKGPLKKEDWIEYPLNQKLEEMCAKEGIAYTNALLPFEGYEAGPLWAVPGLDCHYGPRAAELVAESAFLRLVELDPKK
jgi:hypothetical protein